ncbi:MAG: acyltransferase [Nitratireductor sp.]|nr:acyltransferase [Nitratireductor sp.]
MRPRSAPYFASLDLIRFLAAAWVMLSHYAYIGPMRGLVPYGAAGGLIGYTGYLSFAAVSIFFTLSGFVMLLTSESAAVPDYIAARFIRLAPGFLLCMTATALFLNWLHAPAAPDLATWFANLVLVPQIFGYPFVDGVYWSLVYEAVFYGWIALLLLAGLAHRHTLPVVFAWLVVSIANSLLLHVGAAKYLLITSYSGTFAAGMVMWHAYRNGLRLVHLLLLAMAVYALSLGFVEFSILKYPGGETEPAGLATRLISSAGVVAVVAAGIAFPMHRFSRRLAIGLGGISYPLYLLHQEIGFAAISDLARSLSIAQALFIVTGAVLAVSALVFYVWEKPVQRLLRQWKAGLFGRLVPDRLRQPAE